MNEKFTEKVSIGGVDPLVLYGHHDVNLSMIEHKFDVKIIARGEEITLEGDRRSVQKAADTFRELVLMTKKGFGFDENDLSSVLQYIEEGDKPDTDDSDSRIVLSSSKTVIRPKTPGQYLYVSAIRQFDVTFGIGPAGTGKTYLAVAMAVAALKDLKISRIVLARPAVEAGENLGFLPGDLREKVDPYLAPLYDALHEMVPNDRLRRFMDTKVIEIIPLAFMRGRTLSNAYIILDEAQNTTALQMKMFLTRLGMNSKAVVTGDITQVDLPEKKTSGLIQIRSILANVKGIKFLYLTERDVVRHPLVQKIVKAYSDFENGNGK